MKNLLLTVILLQSMNAFAQVATGLYQDNYTGSTAMLINPAAPFTDPNPWEVNLVSAGVFFDNNYIFYNNQTVFSLINYFQSNYHNGENNSFFASQSLNLNAIGFVQGPSAYYHHDNFVVGFFTDIRGAGGIESNSVPLNLTSLFTVPYNQVITAPVLHAGYMDWAEVGISGGMLVAGSDAVKFYAGADIKYIGALTAAKVANNEAFTLERHSSDSIVTTSPVNVAYSYSQSPSGGGVSNLLSFNGRGFGTDIGVVFVIGEKVSCKELYNWKINGSVNDIGLVSYQDLSFDYVLISNGTEFPDTALVHATTLKAIDQAFSDIVYDAPTVSKAGNSFTIWLPMSATVSADKCLGDGFYINAAALRRLAITNNMIYAPNIELLTPRYESTWFTMAIPLSLYDQTEIHYGLSLRFGPFTIGSDNLESLFVRSELAGTDVYVGLRISRFKSDCKKQKAAKNSDKYDECPPIDR